jgi:hypothetical protein
MIATSVISKQTNKQTKMKINKQATHHHVVALPNVK